MIMTLKQRFSLILAIILIGISAGLVAAALSWLIHTIEFFAFGHSEETYRIVTEDTTPTRRIISMMIGGIFVAVGWWLLQTKGRPIVGINQQINPETEAHRKPPMIENLSHSLLQIVAVGTGAPVGREVAPREIAAFFAGRISHWFAFDKDMRRVLIACGAAAGLAGVYHVPFAGAIFALEILLGVFSPLYAAIAFAISGIAVFVARLEISPEVFYVVGQMKGDWQQTLWAGVIGMLVGLPAAWFRQMSKKAEQTRAKGGQVLWTLPLAFLLTAVIAIWLPQILGNGRSAAQTAYWGVSLGLCSALLVAKTFVVLLTLRSGAYGGTLTPGLSLGALSGLWIGLIAQFIVPEADLLTATLAGSAAFLAVSMNAPLTAFALVVGFTGQGFDSYLPLSIAVACGMATATLLPKVKK
ncbi:chloride channel protein [Conservatibacter flavescens]|uniref:Chloride channel n=1 Tax=Conservatibacter flavescens TaxID=28161 RepID=A0A2M8S5R9_9PAST|nr:chloride channel protein [Conservatibacter flavescens]PJG86487.1 chloride channel [Conservatibacter flavescens]